MYNLPYQSHSWYRATALWCPLRSRTPVAPRRIWKGVGDTGPSQSAGKHFWVAPLHVFGSKSTISRFGERICDGQYSLVSFLFAVLLLTVPPPCPTICKSGGTCPHSLWSRRHCAPLCSLLVCVVTKRGITRTSDGDHGADDSGYDVRIATAVTAADVEWRSLQCD